MPRHDKEFFNLPVLLVELKKEFKDIDDKAKQDVIEEFKKHADEHLLKHLRPVDYRIIDEIPLTLFGKIDYQKVDAMEQNE